MTGELVVPHKAVDELKALCGLAMQRDVRSVSAPVVAQRLRWHAGRYAELAERYGSAEFWRVSQELHADADDLDGGVG